MKMKWLGIAAAALGSSAAFGYLGWLRRWQMRWGATDEEVALVAPGDDLVPNPNFVATRAVAIRARPDEVWPWLKQIGHGRAGWYSYDLLDNQGKESAWEIIPSLQGMTVGDVVPMSEQEGEPFGPTVLALDSPHIMLWGDPEVPHRFTWLWLLRDGQGGIRLVSRVRCRLSWRGKQAGMPAALFALMMEFADPIMMTRCLNNIARRAEALHLRSVGSGLTDRV